ncbi:MAG: tRNA dihydrouridine synthase DusB [Candidatus Omnitrophica bacterium]|nr:tRNA dihydrouridine synthase DusB [Candidatus Omnitrophota bacterium]
MFNIGTLQLQSSLILAPMAGVSDLPFRLITRRFGAELAFTEMLNCRSLGLKSRRTKQMIASNEQDRPLGVQILGSEPYYIKRAIEVLQSYSFDILDFNAACPEKKVTRRGEGAALLLEPKKLQRILELVVQAVSKPVTVKIRTGWDNLSINAPEVAQMAEDAGVKAIFIHGRTKQQLYSGEVDYQTIRQVKRAVKIPVIGSGNIFSGPLAKRMFEETGCDGILIARGSLGNPWIFRSISTYLKEGRQQPLPSFLEVIRIMKEHLRLCVEFFGEKYGVIIYRKFFGWYTKGFPKIRPLRQLATGATTLQELEKIISSILVLENYQRPIMSGVK